MAEEEEKNKVFAFRGFFTEFLVLLLPPVHDSANICLGYTHRTHCGLPTEIMFYMSWLPLPSGSQGHYMRNPRSQQLFDN